MKIDKQRKVGKVLLLGGTGAMGVYLAPELAARGYAVTVVSLDDPAPGTPSTVRHIKGDAKEPRFLQSLLDQKFDAIVDFLIYGTEAFRERHDLLLRSTGHYVYLSSYRVYSGASPVTEETPRLLDVSGDKDFLATEDYSLYKARGEDILRQSGHGNWTIVRPAITYSKRRFQLVTLEAPLVVARAMKDLPLVLPAAALDVPATMSWAGDVARMFAGLILNPAALRESFTLATAEHRTWGEIAGYYREIIGLEYVAAKTDDYLAILGGSAGARYQLEYDRLFPRMIDNSKILRVAGLRQEDMMPLRKGLERELSALPADMVWPDAGAAWTRMDEYLQKRNR